MCLPIAAPMLAALTLAGSTAQTIVSYQAASAQAKAHDAQNEQARKAIALEESLGQMDLARQRQQDWEASATEANAYAAEMRRDWGEFDALVGEGFAGNTAERRAASTSIHHGQDLATLRINATRRQSELGFEGLAVSNSARHKMASLRAADRPSKLGAALTIAGHGVTYAKTMSDLRKSPTT
jgi:hypothetical protein